MMNTITASNRSALIAIRRLADALEGDRWTDIESLELDPVNTRFRLLDVSQFVDRLHGAAGTHDTEQWLNIFSQMKRLVIHSLFGNEARIDSDGKIVTSRQQKNRIKDMVETFQVLEGELKKSLEKRAEITACINQAFENVKRRDVLLVPTRPHADDCYRLISLNKIGSTISGADRCFDCDAIKYAGAVMVFGHKDEIDRYTEPHSHYSRNRMIVDAKNYYDVISDHHIKAGYLLFVDSLSATEPSNDLIEEDSLPLMSARKARDMFYGKRSPRTNLDILENVLSEWRGAAALDLTEEQLSWTRDALNTWNGEALSWSRIELSEHSKGYNAPDSGSFCELISNAKAAAIFRGRKPSGRKVLTHHFRVIEKPADTSDS